MRFAKPFTLPPVRYGELYVYARAFSLTCINRTAINRIENYPISPFYANYHKYIYISIAKIIWSFCEKFNILSFYSEYANGNSHSGECKTEYIR